jgi:hypothetical protein
VLQDQGNVQAPQDWRKSMFISDASFKAA